MLDPMLALLPPWLLITPLIGVIHGSLFFLVAGRRPSSLPVYLALGRRGRIADAGARAGAARRSAVLAGRGEPGLDLGRDLGGDSAQPNRRPVAGL